MTYTELSRSYIESMRGFRGSVITLRQFILNNERGTATIQSQVTGPATVGRPTVGFHIEMGFSSFQLRYHLPI